MEENRLSDTPFALEDDVKEFLHNSRTAALATIDDEGLPHAANVQYASDVDMRLYFVSDPDSAHSRHVAKRRTVAVTVYSHNDRPDQIRGVQIHGICEAMESEEERNAAWELYTAKYAFVTSLPMRKMVEEQTFYRITPHWLRWIDNRRGFGWKVEKDFTA